MEKVEIESIVNVNDLSDDLKNLKLEKNLKNEKTEMALVEKPKQKSVFTSYQPVSLLWILDYCFLQSICSHPDDFQSNCTGFRATDAFNRQSNYSNWSVESSR